LVTTAALKVVPEVELAIETVCPAGALAGVALNVSDEGVALNVDGGGGEPPPLPPPLPPPPPLPDTVRLIMAVLELLPRVAVTVAL
jgi:hypothetical protein